MFYIETKGNSNTIKIIGLVLVVVIVAIIGWQVLGQNSKKEVMTETNQTIVTPATDEAMMMKGSYVDGVYTASGNYQSPAQLEEVEVTLTVTDGVVTDAKFVGLATHPTSKTLQGKFSEGFKEEVVGKKIDDISLTVVNGSSLTPKGFMDALSKIKTQART